MSRVEELRDLPVACVHCDKPATCVGRYESSDNPWEPACDDCCGHGCEDGQCYPVDELPTWLSSVDGAWVELDDASAAGVK